MFGPRKGEVDGGLGHVRALAFGDGAGYFANDGEHGV